MQMSAKRAAAPAASASQTFSAFLSAIRYGDIPQPVVARTGELFPDRLASALAGKGTWVVRSDACASKPDATN